MYWSASAQYICIWLYHADESIATPKENVMHTYYL